jgi:hypothetical protein
MPHATWVVHPTQRITQVAEQPLRPIARQTTQLTLRTSPYPCSRTWDIPGISGMTAWRSLAVAGQTRALVV